MQFHAPKLPPQTRRRDVQDGIVQGDNMPDTKILRVAIAADRCQGHNRCCLVAPELFEPDDEGNARVRGDGTVAAGLEAKARLAVANCPEHAVRLSGA